MSFQEYATAELPAVVARLLADAAAPDRSDLDRLRQALGAATDAVDTLLTRTPSVPATALAALIERLTSAAARDAEASHQAALNEAHLAVDAVHAEVQQLRDTHAALQRDLDRARKETADRQTALDRERARAEAASAEAPSLRRQLEELQDQHERAAIAWQAERKSAAHQLASMANRIETLERAVSEYSAHEQALSEQLATAVESARKAHEGALAAERDGEQHRKEAETARAVIEATQQELVTAQQRTETATAHLQEAQARITTLEDQCGQLIVARQVVEAHLEEVAQRRTTIERQPDEGPRSILERVRQGLVALNQAATTEEILKVLLEQLAQEFATVEVYKVGRKDFTLWRRYSTDPAGETCAPLVPPPTESLLARALAERAPVCMEVGETGAQPLASECLNRYAMAVPVLADGAVLAVVYGESPAGDATDETKVGAQVGEILVEGLHLRLNRASYYVSSPPQEIETPLEHETSTPLRK